ncbi:outer membrane protein OmpA [Noviherbaspirillum massiliense]|uniref:outer membrane protein OmpA n=1 Tax=Noviherbaspirillum massiliense TaxID=1465823 RepID=UPI0002DDE259|nr:OmpA family protein [Noviherbaspirillum massiliense]
MNNLAKLIFAASAVASFSASAQQAVQAPPSTAYLTDSRGVVVMSGSGNCVHSGYWTPADATVVGCDGVVAKAPAPVAAPAPAEPPPPPPAPAPAPTSEKVSLSTDTLFDFDKAVLKPEGREKLDDLVSRLQGMNLEVIIAVGHTDSIGSTAYNQKLSMRRAEAVKAYLVSKGIEANRVYTEGKGESQPVKTDCNPKQARKQLIECLAPNRRVEVEVVGTRTR